MSLTHAILSVGFRSRAAVPSQRLQPGGGPTISSVLIKYKLQPATGRTLGVATQPPVRAGLGGTPAPCHFDTISVMRNAPIQNRKHCEEGQNETTTKSSSIFSSMGHCWVRKVKRSLTALSETMFYLTRS